MRASPPTDMAISKALRSLGLEFTRLERRPHAYRSSFPVDELRLLQQDGSAHDLVFKDLNWGRLIPEAIDARPEFLFDPMREIEVYEHVLAPTGLGARYYGKTIDAELGRHWLFIERVYATELHQFGEIEIWQAAAQWLARLHVRFAGMTAGLPGSIIERGPHSDATWLGRALSFHSDREAPERTSALHRVAEAFHLVIGHLDMQPPTFLHGEFYSTNILIRHSECGPEVIPVDWENAAIGPGLLDLAALVSGPWSEADRLSIVSAYHEALPIQSRPSLSQLIDDLAWCRLHLAIQWLGWSPTWQPPPEKQHDWLGDLTVLAEELDL